MAGERGDLADSARSEAQRLTEEPRQISGKMTKDFALAFLPHIVKTADNNL